MNARQHHYFALYKPCGMVSQFRSSHQVSLLGDLDFIFPEGTHAIGRLDRDSEGLLLLTTNKTITHRLFKSGTPHRRTYLVQVRGLVGQEVLQRLSTGVPIRVGTDSWYTTQPCAVHIVPPPSLPPSPFDYPDFLAHTWLQLVLTEGKYHQVRKMVAAVGHRCMRLVRTSIEHLALDNLPPGKVRELSEADFFTLLGLGTPDEQP